MYIEYPKCMYHRELPAATVRTPDEEAALGEGWVSHPSKFDAEEPAAEAKPKKPKKAEKAEKEQ